jgi:ankyrin repeat protein
MEAASTGNSSLLERMLEMGVDVNVQAEDGYTALHCAAKTGQVAIMSFLLDKGAAVDLRNIKIQERRPIHEAILARHVEAIAILLHAGANLLLSDAKGRTVIDYIGLAGDIKIAQSLFLEERKQVCAPEMASLLVMACAKSGNHLVLRWLLDRFQNPLPQSTNYKKCPLYVATTRGHKEVVILLLSLSQSSNYTSEKLTKSISASLVWATWKDSTDLTKALLGCDTINPNDMFTYQQMSPLHHAAHKGNLQVVEMLLSHPKIDVNIEGYSNSTPLHSAARIGCEDVIKLLLVHKDIDTQRKGVHRQTPLEVAFFNFKWSAMRLIADHQNLAPDLEAEFIGENMPSAHPRQDRLLVSLLLNRGLLSAKPDDYNGLLAKVILVGAPEDVKILVDCLSLNINAYLYGWDSGLTALHVAAQHHRHDIFRFYLEDPRIDVNRKSRQWNQDSVLHHVIRHNCMTAVKLLLARPEINLTLRNSMGNTALDLARALGKREMFELLLSHGAFGKSLEMDSAIVDKHASEPSCWTDQDEEQLRRLNVRSNVVEMEDSDIDSDSEEDEDVDMLS